MGLFLQYVEARLRLREEEALFRVYLTDCQKALLDGMSHLAGGSRMTRRYLELLEPAPSPKSGEEIARDVLSRAGIKVIEHGSV